MGGREDQRKPPSLSLHLDRGEILSAARETFSTALRVYFWAIKVDDITRTYFVVN